MTGDASRSTDERHDDGAAAVEAEQPPAGKLLLELGPLAIFFFVNSQYGIFTGTAAFMIATVIALTASRYFFGRIPLMPLISGVFILIFGALTIVLNDELFIKIKPTIVNSIFASALFGGLIFGQPLLRYLFGEVFRLTDRGWFILTFRWACFFVVLAILNEVVWRNFSNDFWIGFKLFGVMPLTLVFAVAQVGVLKRYELKPAPRGRQE